MDFMDILMVQWICWREDLWETIYFLPPIFTNWPLGIFVCNPAQAHPKDPTPVHHHMGVFKNGACCIAFFLKERSWTVIMDYHKNNSIVILNYHCTTMEKRSILLTELEI